MENVENAPPLMHYSTGDLEKENRHPSAIIKRFMYLPFHLFRIFARTFNAQDK